MVLQGNVSYFQCIEMAVFDSTTLSGSFQTMNGAAQQPVTSSVGFQGPIKMLKVYNDGTTGVTISYDGSTGHDYLPSKGTMILDLQTNHTTQSSNAAGELRGRQGQLVYGKGTASASGSIYISGYL